MPKYSRRSPGKARWRGRTSKLEPREMSRDILHFSHANGFPAA
jgi:hypothetical protein